MKCFTFSFVIILLFSTFGIAQSIGLFGGFTNTAFEGQGEAASGFEVGAAFLFDALPILGAGIEFSTSVSPFEFSVPTLNYTQKYKQTMFGVFARYSISLPTLAPYFRAGAGYYLGSVEDNFPQVGAEITEGDFKNTLGFNLGAGVDTFIGLNAEFVYHIVSKELDVTDAKSFGANYWGLRVGYYFSLL